MLLDGFLKQVGVFETGLGLLVPHKHAMLPLDDTSSSTEEETDDQGKRKKKKKKNNSDNSEIGADTVTINIGAVGPTEFYVCRERTPKTKGRAEKVRSDDVCQVVPVCGWI